MDKKLPFAVVATDDCPVRLITGSIRFQIPARGFCIRYFLDQFQHFFRKNYIISHLTEMFSALNIFLQVHSKFENLSNFCQDFKLIPKFSAFVSFAKLNQVSLPNQIFSHNVTILTRAYTAVNFGVFWKRNQSLCAFIVQE